MALDETVGFCELEVNPFGPVQLYEAPLAVGVERLSVVPLQTGPLFPAVGVVGAVPQSLSALPLLRGLGVAAAKSVEFSSVSVQPPLAR